MPFQYIAIEGPIGVGKSSLAERIASRLEATVVLEEADNPFLADFYAGRAGAALQAQLFYLLNRHRQLAGLQQGNLFSQATVCDYVFDKDKIFAYLNLDDNELFIYQRLYDLLTADIPSPDLVVYLQAPPLLVVETSQLGLDAGDEAVDDLIRQIRTMNRGTRYYVPRT